MRKYVKTKNDFTTLSAESGELKTWGDFWQKLQIRSNIECWSEFTILETVKALSTADEDWLVHFWFRKAPVFTESPTISIKGNMWIHWYSHWINWRFIENVGVDDVEYDIDKLPLIVAWENGTTDIIYQTIWKELSEEEKRIVCEVFRTQFNRKINEFIKENKTKFFNFLDL